MKMRRTFLLFASISFLVSLAGCKSCVEQHDPRPAQERHKQEQEYANMPIEKLNPDGTLPVATTAASGGAVSIGKQKFDQVCSACHGTNGRAQDAAALAMNPHPRNLTDPKWQDSVDDARISKVIKGGGASIGLSPTMAAWGAVLSDQEIAEVVKHVRSLKGK